MYWEDKCKHQNIGYGTVFLHTAFLEIQRVFNTQVNLTTSFYLLTINITEFQLKSIWICYERDRQESILITLL